MVELKNISVVYNQGEDNEKVALDDISLKIEDGSFVTIVGPNGAGKSTLLKIVLGEVQPTSGAYIVDGKVMNGVGTYKLAKSIGRVYQDPNSGVFPKLTIGENLIISARKGMRYFSFSKVKNEALDLLKGLGIGLEDRLSTLAGQLSGGQKQSLAMVMSIVSRPSLLLLDEHTASLDPKSASNIMELTKRINQEYGITIMMITHNMEFARNYGDRLINIVEGNIADDSMRIPKVYAV